jgi:imidazolonepropionase-like amidohydrolase
LTRPPLVISGATVLTMSDRRPLTDHSVLIRDGRIESVGPRGALERSGFEVLDGSGRFLMPGLADMHVHWWRPEDGLLYLARGVTTVRNMAGAPLHVDLARRVERGELAGPHLVTASPVIDGMGEDGQTVWPSAQLLIHPEKAGPLVRRYASQGYRQVKAYTWLRYDVLQALGRAAAEAGLPLTGHCPEGLTFEEAMAAGMRCFEHLLGIERGHLLDGGRTPVRRRPVSSARDLRHRIAAASHVDYGAIRRLAARMAALQVWNCPTLVLNASARDPAPALADPRLHLESPGVEATWKQAAAAVSDQVARLHRVRGEMFSRVVAILHDEGAPLLLGTDCPNPFVFQGSSVLDELAHLVAAGLDRWEALRCATSEAARFLGEEGEWGTVARGQRADLLLLSRDPLHDLDALREPEAVFVAGRRVSGDAPQDGAAHSRGRERPFELGATPLQGRA